MSQQSNYVEKNVAEESAAMAAQEVVSITIPIIIIIISVICTYFFIFFPRKPAPIPLMRKIMTPKPHKKEEQQQQMPNLPPVTM